MNALRPSIFRPTGRPSPPPTPILSPTPTQPRTEAADKASRTISTLSLTGCKRPSSTPSVPPSQAAIVQDGSYLQVLSLKLSEGVSKALAQPVGPAPPN